MSETLHALGTCRICTNGDLVFAVVLASGRVIIKCLECMTGYVDLNDLDNSATIRMEDTEARAASRGDLAAAGASDLITH